MRKRIISLWIALFAAVLMVPAALGADADPSPGIQITGTHVEGRDLSFTASLSGADPTGGSLFVVVRSQDGQMEQFSDYAAAASVPVSLSGVDDTDSVSAAWVDEDYAVLASADVGDWTGSVEAESYEDQDAFAEAVMAMVREHDTREVGAIAESDDEYALARLIVCSSDPLPALGAFHITGQISDDEHHTILQFDSPAAARACEEYLRSRISADGYIEPDKPIVLPVPDEAEEEGMEAGSEGMEEDGTSGTAKSWGVAAIHADKYATDLMKRGVTQEVKVAVVDTGVDYTHPFLRDRTVAGYDYVAGDSDPMDEHYHGTHVAGTIVDCTPGLSNIKIMPVRVLNASGSGTSLCVGLGIRYAADHGAGVINMSLGGPHSSYKDEAVDYAVSKNVTVVVAAGNDSKDAKDFCPAHIEKCITVSAVDKNFRPAYFTNYGTVVDLAAPGVDIKSCAPGGGDRTLSGTSMASPHVAACAAMLRSDLPSLTPSQVETRLVSAVQKPSGWNTKYGAGVVDVEPFVQGSADLYAILYTDGEMVFQTSNTRESGRTVLHDPYPINSSSGANSEYVLWYDQRTQIKKVTFKEKVHPASTSLWFYGCTKLTTIQGLENLDLSGVTDMKQMFNGCTGLTTLDLSKLDTKNVKDMSQMFRGCSALRTIIVSDSFVTTAVTSSTDMFFGCTSLVGELGTTYSSSRTDKTYARIDGGTSRPGYLSSGSTAGLYAILYTDGEMVFQASRTPASGKTVRQTYTVGSSSGASSEYAAWYDQRAQITKVTFKEKVRPASTALWFYGCTNLTTIQNIGNLDLSGVTSMKQMFNGCTGLTTLDLSKLDTKNVKDMGQMFRGCTKLQTLDLRGWDTRNVTSMSDMFAGSSVLRTIYASSTFSVSKVTDGSTMFDDCTSLRGEKGTTYSSSHRDKTYARIDGGTSSPGYLSSGISVSVPDPSTTIYAVLYTDGTLAFQSSLTSQSGKTASKTYQTDSGGYDGDVWVAWYDERAQIRTVDFTTAIYPTSTALWFLECENLSTIRNIDRLHTDYVTDMSQMFSYCSSLTSLDLSGFVTGKTTNTETMFFRCSKLTRIYASSSFSTSQITNSGEMFYGCSSLRGGNGTAYSDSHTDKTYARIDQSFTPGYFTSK